MISKNHGFLRFLAFVFFGFTIVNLVYLNYIVFNQQRNVGPLQIASTADVEKSSVCDTAKCVPELYDAIYQATASLQMTEQSFLQQGSSQTPEEFYIPFGGGTNSTSTWADVSGASAYIDSTKYGTIKTVTFEASVYIPTGNQTAYVQLYNATDQHPVWFSTVSLSGGQPQLLISSPITLDPGEKLYQVQMMTQLQYPAVLTQSRVHILSQ